MMTIEIYTNWIAKRVADLQCIDVNQQKEAEPH